MSGAGASGIDTAILLAAGHGSRLRPACPVKPLCAVAGRALIDHALDGLAHAGMRRAIVVTGYEAEAIEAHLAAREGGIGVDVVRNPDWREPNGVSALAAAPLLEAESALLAMCDHVVEPALYRRMAAAGAGSGLRLGVDRRLGHPWVDPDDVTRVRTQGDRIIAIGKHLDPCDCYDTGVFAVGAPFFAALVALDRPSISDAVGLLAGEDRADTVDCSDLGWIDVDDATALAAAEEWLGGARGIAETAPHGLGSGGAP